jgi:hypothetical protein
VVPAGEAITQGCVVGPLLGLIGRTKICGTEKKVSTFYIGLGFKKGKKFTQVDLATGEERWFLWERVGPMAAPPGS